MPEPSPEEDPHSPIEEEGGGPVKTFLEHLEDLRWMLIKCVATLLLSMLFCLVASNQLVALLTWPLKQAQALRTDKDVQIHLGDLRLGHLPESQATNLLPWKIETRSRIDLGFSRLGTNVVLTAELVSGETGIAGVNAVALKNYSPMGAFMVALQLMLYGGMVVAAPLIILFAGQFVLPALHVHEKRFLYQTAGFGAALFVAGIGFCYFIIMQIALTATVRFSQWMGFGADEWRAEDYISFVCKLMLAAGVSFQLPVVLLTMVKAGVLDREKLNRFRPYWVVINLAGCAILTPTGDPFTLLLIAIPLQGLYELSVLISRFWEKRDAERMEDTE